VSVQNESAAPKIRSDLEKERAQNYVDTSIMSRLEAEGFTDAAHKEFSSK
jgi:hypothetical protein